MSPSRPRVLHVGKFYPPVSGGMERVLQLLCEREKESVDTRGRGVTGFPAVHHGHGTAAAAQHLGGAQPGGAAANDQDVMECFYVFSHGSNAVAFASELANLSAVGVAPIRLGAHS